MKKLFKKGLIALTLMLGMTFAAPQNASAKDQPEAKYEVDKTASPDMFVCWGKNGCLYCLFSSGLLVEYNPITGTIRGW